MSIALPSKQSDREFNLESPKTAIDLCKFGRFALNMAFQKVVEFFMDRFDDGPLICPFAPHVRIYFQFSTYS